MINLNFLSFNLEIIGNIAIFLIFFALITWALRKTMLKDSKGTLIAISVSSTILAFYGLLKLNFSISDLMYQLNISKIIQYNLLIILAILLIIFLWNKIGLGITLIILGLLMFLTGIFSLVYANASIGIIGAILILVGIFIKRKTNHRRDYKKMNLKDREDYKKLKRN
jgi:hypothetical protein